MAILVVNKQRRVSVDANVTTIYCGRGTPLGNPYYMKNEQERDRVCDAYEDWFPAMLEASSQQCDGMRMMLTKINKLASVGDVHLQCFCAPKRCHCDTIKRYVENVMQCSTTSS